MVKNKKSTQKKVNAKKSFSPFRWWKELYAKDRFISVFILMALIAVIAGIIWGSLIANEKWQFNKAEKALDSLYTDIVAELGEPVSYEKTKSCGYSSAKYSKGDLACNVGYALTYPGTNTSTFAEKVFDIYRSIGVLSGDEKLYAYDEVLGYSINLSLNGVQIRCGSYINDKDSANQYLTLSCGSNPRHQVYPLRD